jgi:hypothetical protein
VNGARDVDRDETQIIGLRLAKGLLGTDARMSDVPLSFAQQMQRDFPIVGPPAMLEKIDALPRPECEPAIDHGNR